MAENNFSLQKTLTMLLDEKKYHSLRDILSTMNPADLSLIHILRALTEQNRQVSGLLSAKPLETAGAVQRLLDAEGALKLRCLLYTSRCV